MNGQVVRELQKTGFLVQELPNLDSQRFCTYYKPDGEAVKLPADPYSLHRYLRRGFTLSPPSTSKPQETKVRKAKGKI
jgi:hypothetical protein